MGGDILTLEDLEQDAAEEVSIAIEQLKKARVGIRPAEPNNSSSNPDNFDVDSEVQIEQFMRLDIETGDVGYDDTKIGSLPKTSDLWEEAEKLVGAEQNMVKLMGKVMKRKLNTGSWYNPIRKLSSSSSNESTTRKVVENVIPSGFLSRIIKPESYAVVTFTSRQAAIAARQCLSDGSGLEGWREVDKIPIPPLADSVPWNISDCRGCCRPVTVTLPPQQRNLRFKM